MTDRALYIIASDATRLAALDMIRQAPWNTRVEIKGSRRSLPQNARFWAMCTDVARAATHHGLTLSPADWRLLFLDGWRRDSRVVPNLDGDGFVTLGRSSADLTREEMSEAMEYMAAWCARNAIAIHEPRENA